MILDHFHVHDHFHQRFDYWCIFDNEAPALFKQVDCSLKQDGPIDIGISVRQAKFLQRRYQATFQTAAVIRSEVQLLRQLIGFLEADAFDILEQSVRIFI